MPTGQELLEDQRFVESQGYIFTVLDKDRARATWYRPDGIALPGLPVDMYHRTLYRRKGWTLKPPESPVATDQTEVASARDMPSAAERAEVLGIKELAPPPKHIHVMQLGVGSPCLVLGCTHVRQAEKVVVTRNPKKKREKVNAR